ncbi:MAG: hypothetical protein NTX65_05035 [Ignavibacteriales bacterium]|nr:hypothetical protein [Ignavibacteriales bacterium]
MSVLLAIIAISTSCTSQEDSITANVPSGLKIPVESNINGKIIREMIGIDITHKNKLSKTSSVLSGGLEDQYLVDDFNHDGYADVAVRRGYYILIDTNRDGVSDIAFSFGNGNSERCYEPSNGGIAIVRGSSVYVDDNLDGTADRSFSFGNGNSEDQYIFMRPSGIAVRRGNQIIYDYGMDGNADGNFYFGNGNSEDQYIHGFDLPSSGGWSLRRDYVWHHYYTTPTYSYGYGNSEDGYFLGKFDGGSNYDFAVLRGNTLYYDNNRDGTADGNFSFGSGLK